jgi:hypothetical protein
MKKIILAATFLLMVASLFAKNKENINYVKVDGTIYFGSKIKTGFLNTTLITSDGKKMKFDNHKIDARMNKGKLFELLPLVCNNHKNMGMAMMEFVTSKDGLKLYRYTCCNAPSEIEQNIVDMRHPDCIYFVFKDGKYHLTVNSANVENVLPFFGIPVIS